MHNRLDGTSMNRRASCTVKSRVDMHALLLVNGRFLFVVAVGVSMPRGVETGLADKLICGGLRFPAPRCPGVSCKAQSGWAGERILFCRGGWCVPAQRPREESKRVSKPICVSCGGWHVPAQRCSEWEGGKIDRCFCRGLSVTVQRCSWNFGGSAGGRPTLAPTYGRPYIPPGISGDRDTPQRKSSAIAISEFLQFSVNRTD